MKNKLIIGFCIISLVLTLNLVLGFTPLAGYSSDTPLNVYPGEEREVLIKIYPAPEEGTVSVEGTMIEGMEIASITDASNIYESPQTTGGEVHLKIKIPSDALVGSEYKVVTRFVDKTPQTSTGGTVGFNVEATNSFKVIVVEKPKTIPGTESKGIIWQTLVVLIIIAIILIAYFMFKKKR
ncbi:MAG: hypothetical protein WCX73_05885 [Candidatus Pacearchaeota archaeon]|jgi:hypothetical protein